MSFKTLNFAPQLQALESRLDNFPIKETLGDYFIRILRKNRDFSRKCLAISRKNIRNVEDPHKKVGMMRDEISLIKTYLSNKNQFYANQKGKTDILNIYWSSKEDVNIEKEIESNLDCFSHELSGLEQ